MFWKVLARTSGVTSWMASLMFAFKASMLRGFWRKLALSNVPTKNNQAALDRASVVAKVPWK
jgi:hypothetical protein